MEARTSLQHNPVVQQNGFDENVENENDGGNGLAEKCQSWLEKCNVSDNCSVYSDSDSSVFTDTTTNSAMESGLIFQNDGLIMANQIVTQKCDPNGPLIIKENENPKYDNINVYKSRKVHIGDVTYINGPVIITNNSENKTEKLSDPYDDTDDEPIVNRMNWLAQPALGEKEYLDGPAKYVIICHTATQEGHTQADNTLHVRLIQTFHIESRKWKDIAYNFLIGSDGLAYEGRGWRVVGSHTRGYNRKCIGIAFIGCFLSHLPPEKSLKKAKELIELGVKRGSIVEDYTLLAHCQCVAIESPGRRLFEEIKTWEHWDGSVDVPTSTFTSDAVIEEPPDEDDLPQNLP